VRGISLLVALIMSASACGDDAAGPSTTSSIPASSTTPGRPGDGQAAAALANAIDAVGDEYAFTSTVTAEGDLVTQVDGTLSGDTGLYVVQSGGATLEYLISPDGRWVREPQADWVRLPGAAPVGAPLAVLATPISVEVAQPDDPSRLRATYEGASLGFGEGAVEVEITIRSGMLAEIEYVVSLGEGQGSVIVVTTIDGDAEIDPIPTPDA
jgi:hypothetical protein